MATGATSARAWRSSATRRAMVTALFAFGFAMLASGLINVSEIFLAERAFHRGAFGYGLLWAASGLGLVDRQPLQQLPAGGPRHRRDLPARLLAVGGRHPGRGDRAERLGGGLGLDARRLRERPRVPVDRSDRAALHRRPAARPSVHADHQRAQRAARHLDGHGRRTDRPRRRALDLRRRVCAPGQRLADGASC